MKFGCHFQNLFTGGKILLIVAFIGLGFCVANPQDISLTPSRSDLNAVFSPAFAISLVYVFWCRRFEPVYGCGDGALPIWSSRSI